MINKVKASLSEKILFVFLILLFLTAFGSYFLLKDKCLFVKKINLNENTNILLFGCEGDADEELYQKLLSE